MDWIVWVIIALGGLAIFGFLNLVRDTEQRGQLDALLRQHAGEGEVLSKKSQIGPSIGLALRGDRFFLGVDQAVVEFPSSAIIEASVQTDGATVTRVSRSSQIGGAAVGAVIAGPLGAAVGALSASSRTALSTPKDVRLRLVIDSDDFPLVDIPFIEATATGVTNGHVALRQAEEWLARIKVLMRRRKNAVSEAE